MVWRRIIPALKVLALLLALAAGSWLIAVYLNKGKLLSVQSGSMAPAIREGDLVSVKNVPFEELKEGDVITFASPDKQAYVTHRVVALLPEDPAGNNIITKGDANTNEDAPTEAANIIGRVERRIPFVGYGLNFLRTWPGLVAIIYIPAAVVTFSEIRRLASYYRSLYYALPEFLMRRKAGKRVRVSRGFAAVAVAGTAAFAAVLPAQALLQGTTLLTGNTISTAKTAPRPEPSPEPPAPKKPSDDNKPGPQPAVPGGVTLGRVFVACDEGEDEADRVRLVLRNSSRLDADVSGWTVKSGRESLLKLPAYTIVPANGTYETEAPILAGVSYSNWELTLFNADGEKIHEHVWEVNTTRDCRMAA